MVETCLSAWNVGQCCPSRPVDVVVSVDLVHAWTLCSSRRGLRIQQFYGRLERVLTCSYVELVYWLNHLENKWCWEIFHGYIRFDLANRWTLCFLNSATYYHNCPRYFSGCRWAENYHTTFHFPKKKCQNRKVGRFSFPVETDRRSRDFVLPGD